jgi:phosphohistidine phosphatase
MAAGENRGFSADTMNLILWRHAEAEDGVDDARRELTARGRKQAERMARWLKEQLPERFEVLASPAVRTCQTADALGVPYRTDRRLAPGADVADCLAAIDWPDGPKKARGTVVLVGHQPTLGRIASLLMAGHEMDWSVKKGAVWWIASRERDAVAQRVLRAAVSPDMV